MRRIILGMLALGMTLIAPSALSGQVAARAAVGGLAAERPEFDYFVSRYRDAGPSAESGGVGAVGARLMWPLASLSGSPLLTRASLGGYVVHSPEDEELTRSWRYGAQADVRVTRLPVAGRVDPLVSLGVGASRMQQPPAPVGREARVSQTRTYLSVAPGVGLRLLVTPGLGLRGDARQVLDFSEGVQRRVELSGGLSLGV
jgi:hypothetical protein